MSISKCIECSGDIVKPKSNKKFCSSKCRKLYHAKKSGKIYCTTPPASIKCEVCPNIIHSPRADQRFCSMVCGSVGQKITCKNNPIECAMCFDVVEFPRSNQMYCSELCSTKASRKRKKDSKIGGKICKWCAHSYYSYNKMFCSKECSFDYTRNKPKKIKICYYCGLQANSIEHIIPQMIRMSGPTIPACIECNCIIGSFLGSVEEKLVYLKRQLKKKYADILQRIGSPEYDLLISRLAWVPDPLPDTLLRRLYGFERDN